MGYNNGKGVITVSYTHLHITFDLGLLSHYEYYTGVIFKAYTYGTGDAIVTGGRYDNLVEQFGKKTPAVGFALLLDQLMEALRSQEIPIEAQDVYKRQGKGSWKFQECGNQNGVGTMYYI